MNVFARMLGPLAGALLLGSCASLSPAQIGAELEERRAAAQEVFHYGCTAGPDGMPVGTVGSDGGRVTCDTPGRFVCGWTATQALTDASTGFWMNPRPILVEWFGPRLLSGVSRHYWFVGRDGSAVYFWEVTPAPGATECPGGCGWRKQSVAGFVDETGRPRIALQPQGLAIVQPETCSAE